MPSEPIKFINCGNGVVVVGVRFPYLNSPGYSPGKGNLCGIIGGGMGTYPPKGFILCPLLCGIIYLNNIRIWL